MVHIKQRPAGVMTEVQLEESIIQTLSSIGNKKRILVIPPDISRYHSMAGYITQYIRKFYKDSSLTILPATGLHAPMKKNEITYMFGDIPLNCLHHHDPVNTVSTIGSIPGHIMADITGGLWDSEWVCQVNSLLCSQDFDLIISIGQVVPHEVSGMSNYNKNIFVGVGGKPGIDSSHYISALYGIEKTMGNIDTPVRRMFNYASEHFLGEKQILYILTVIHENEQGEQGIKGLFIGDDAECFNHAAQCSREFNIIPLKNQIDKVIVYLDPLEYKSTWLGNKGIYRSRKAIKRGGELLLIGPGISSYGESQEIDRLIRTYGYAGTEKIKDYISTAMDLRRNLSVAAHLIHGSTDDKFTVTLCPGKLTKKEVEQINFRYGDPVLYMQKYDPFSLQPGYNYIEGEEIFFIKNPGLGLWYAPESN